MNRSSAFDRLLRPYVPSLLLIAAVLAAYANSFANGFVFDDETFIVRNIFLNSWSSIGRIFTTNLVAGSGNSSVFYRPLQILLYLVIVQTSGLKPFGFHLLNMALHAANVCLVYALGKRFGFNPLAVFMAALLWGVHPIHTEAITNMSGTADPLYAFFCLLGIHTLLPDFAPAKMGRACLCFILALASKESALPFPLLVMSCIFLLDPRRLQPKIYLKTWPLWLIAALYVLVRTLVIGLDTQGIYHGHDEYARHMLYRFYTFLSTLPLYGSLLVWPHDLHVERSIPTHMALDDWPVLFGAEMVVAAFAQIIWGQGRRGLALAWGLLWFAASLVMHSGILLPINAKFFEHWMYLASAGLFLGVAESLAQAGKQWRAITRYAVCIAGLEAALVLAAGTYAQNRIWSDPITFYENLVEYKEGWAAAENNLGVAYHKNGDFDKAIEHYRAAIALNDSIPDPHYNIARLLPYQKDGMPVQEAIAELERAIAIDPNYFLAYKYLGDIYAMMGDKDKAEANHAKAEAIKNRNMHNAP